MASLLVVIASLFVIFGALSSSLLPPSDDYSQDILMLSHATACMLLLLYILWFQFRFRTHTNLAEPWYSKEDNERCPNLPPRSRPAPSLAFFITLTTLSCAVICARYLIASVDAVVQSEHISRTFIGLVLLPTSTYTFNYIQTFAIACEDKMNLAVELTLGASVDVTFVILPVLILIGWAIRQPMSMQFQLLETILLAVSVFLTSSIVSNGKSNYLEGAMYLGM